MNNNRLSYHIQNKYNESGKLIEQFNFDADGKIQSKKNMIYNDYGLLIEERSFEENTEFPSEKEVYSYNDKEQKIKVESYQCNKNGADCGEPWSVTTFKYNEYGLETQNMLIQNYGDSFGERKVYKYREST